MKDLSVLIIQENGRHVENRSFRECFCLQRGFKKINHKADVWGLGHENYSEKPDYESYFKCCQPKEVIEKKWINFINLLPPKAKIFPKTKIMLV